MGAQVKPLHNFLDSIGPAGVTDYVILEDLLSESQLNTIQDIIADLTLEPSKMYPSHAALPEDPRSIVDTDFRAGKQISFPYTQKSCFLWDLMNKAVFEANEQVWQFDLFKHDSLGYQNIEFLQYNAQESAHVDWHVDDMPKLYGLDKRPMQHKLSVLHFFNKSQ